MNQKRLQIFLVIIFLSAACSPAATTLPTVTTTETPSPFPTNTSRPTETPTPSIIPLPTIATFTPTFDASTIITVTPAPKSNYPEVNKAIMVRNYFPQKLEYPSLNTTEKLLDFLNEGGDGQELISRLKQIYPEGGDYRGGYEYSDVTGDQIPEFLYTEIYYEGRLHIFSCKRGRYELLATLPEENKFLEYTMQVVNLNMNGIPEIIVMGTNGVSYPISTIYFYEWNGNTFVNLGQLSILALRQTKIADADGNGTKEISFSGDDPSCLSCKNFIPQRERTITYGWNGKKFVEVSNVFSAPEYRFQAIQDADARFLVGKLEEAFRLYEEGISNKKLEWWSPERMEYQQALSDSWIPDLILPPEPLEDKSEYRRLAAYAYYRIMLIHFAQGNEQKAAVDYDNLQKSLGNNEASRPYIEMAAEFWSTYQPTHKMYDGCAAAIQYAVEHPEILIPLGSDYHGWQSHIYEPVDICPFR